MNTIEGRRRRYGSISRFQDGVFYVSDESIPRTTDESSTALECEPSRARGESLEASSPSGRIPPVRHRRKMGPVPALHWGLLILSCLVLFASIILDVQESHVTPGIVSIPLPGLCTFRRLTGMDCPGCGLTRCFVSMSHGRFAAALAFNPVGMLLYVAMVFQIPYRIIQLRRIRAGLREIDSGWLGSGFLMIVATLLIAQWVIRIMLGV